MPRACIAVAVLALSLAAKLSGGEPERPGVVSNIKVISDKVEDVTTLEDWKRTYIKDGMSDQEKAIAVWKAVVKYRHQTTPPNEYFYAENVHDPMKTIHVYGYGMCCCAASNIEGFARYVGLPARGRIINQHSVPEVFYGGSWHLLDGSLMNYFLKEDGTIASVDELRQAVRGWFEQNPDKAPLRGIDSKLREFARDEGWKRGPALLARSPFYDRNGINPAGWHGWPSSMQEYDISDQKAAVFDYGPSMGYQVNIQLREGERLTRNWHNKGLMVPGDLNDPLLRGDRSALGFQARLGDIAPGRIGNGVLEYDVPLASGAFRGGALAVENLAARVEDRTGPALHVRDAGKPGRLVLRMSSSYVYLTGEADLTAVVGEGGSIIVTSSINNGLDWKELARIDRSGEVKIDLKPACYLHYDYRLSFEIAGKGSGLDTLRIRHDIQHSQAPLPALGEGANTIAFSAGAAEGTITVEGGMSAENSKGRQILHTDYHPVLTGLASDLLLVGETGKGEAIYTIEALGEIARVRMNAHYRARDARDGFEVGMSFDGGRAFRKVEDLGGPVIASSKYFTCSDVPPGAKAVQVKLAGRQRNTACIFDLRFDVDYREPHGGFRPVKITYLWEENGQPKEDVHIAREPRETYAIRCGSRPLMKSIVLELAE